MAPRTKVQMPDLTNATPTMLVDEMGKLSVLESYVKKLRAYYKDAYYQKVGIESKELGKMPEPLAGEVFTATTSQSEPQRVNVTLLKEKYPEIAAECTGGSVVTTTRFTLNEGVVNPVVNDLLQQMLKELDLE